MKRLPLGLAILGIVLLSASMISAQAPAPGQGQGRGDGRGQGRGQGRGAGAPQPPPTNLQVLPKDMTRPQVVMIMQTFVKALGVTCAHCHIFIGPNDPMNDFASDMKPTKTVARAMIRATREINAKFGTELGKPAADVLQVECMTCHRGSVVPNIAPAAPPAAPAAAPPA